MFANNGINGRELWVSNGTTAGTTLVKDAYLGTNNSTPLLFANANGTIFFRANDGIHGYELWKTDGTTAGTVLVKDILSGINSSSVSPNTSNLEYLNGFVYFQANDGVSGNGLWKSDGTAAGTTLVKSFDFMEVQIAKMGNYIYFQTITNLGNYELWRSDGSVAGTTKVKDVYIQMQSGYGTFPFSVVGNNLYFASLDLSTQISSLWKSDGTTGGTIKLKDFPGFQPYYFTPIGSTLYFIGNDNVSGSEIWKSDGTIAGTVLVSDINAGSSGSTPSELVAVGNLLFFTAENSNYRTELWRTDGTTAGTSIIDIVTG